LSIAELGFSAIGPWLLENEISIYHSTPTVYRGFLNSCETASRFPDVRHVVLGGEARFGATRTCSDVPLVSRAF